jgi:hypothetical protein
MPCESVVRRVPAAQGCCVFGSAGVLTLPAAFFGVPRVCRNTAPLSLSLSLAAACFGVPRVCRNTAPLSLTRGGIEPGARLQRSRRQVLAGQGAGVLRAGGGARALLPRARVPGAGAPATQQLRIVTVGVSGGKSLTGPLRDARRFLSTRWYSVQETTRTALGFGICPSFKAHSVAPCQTLALRFATFASL